MVVVLCTFVEIQRTPLCPGGTSRIRFIGNVALTLRLLSTCFPKVSHPTDLFGSIASSTGRRASHALTGFFFLKYEDMMSEPVKHVIKLATFLSVPFSIKEEEDGIPEEVVRLCSFDKLSSLDTNQTGQLVRPGNIIVEKSVFFRKGKVGDWVNHMSQEMGRKLDCIVEEKLKPCALMCISFYFYFLCMLYICHHICMFARINMSHLHVVLFS